MTLSTPGTAPTEPIHPLDDIVDTTFSEVDCLDSDGEAYVAFNLDDEWPGHFGCATVGVP